MAVHFRTKTPRRLLTAYKKAVDDDRVKAWQYDGDGDFTLTAPQWNKKAWLRPKVIPAERLTFHILSPLEDSVSSAVYAIYHGRIVESVLRHCETFFEEASVSAMPEGNDIVG